MEENNLNRERESESIDIKVLVEKFITRWRWFAVSVPLCLVIALLICQSRVPIYNVTGKVMISDSKKGETGNERDDERAGLGGGGYVCGERDRGATVEEPDAGGRGGTGLERPLRP